MTQSQPQINIGIVELFKKTFFEKRFSSFPKTQVSQIFENKFQKFGENY